MVVALTQTVTGWPASAGPSQTWRPAAVRFPLGGTTRSNSTAAGTTAETPPRALTAAGSGGGSAVSSAGSRNGQLLDQFG